MTGRDPAPRFIDFHDDLTLPAEAIDQIAAGTRPRTTDQFGMRQIDRYHNADGKAYGLLEGPDEEAIRKHHQALSIPLRRRAPSASGDRTHPVTTSMPPTSTTAVL